MPVPPSVVDEIRDFSGLVDIPGPTTMDLSLGIRRQSVDATPLLPEFFATLFAQETGTVSGTYTIQTAPPRTGVVEGRFDGESFLTAGEARVVLIEDTGGCIARRQYSGPVTAAGVNWVAGATIQPCPSAPFAELRSIVITATGSTHTTDPSPGPDPGPDPGPGPTFTLTVMLSGSGGGTVTSSPTGINCGVDCTEDYAEGTAVTLTPTSNAGSVFAGWTGDGDGSVTMDADRSCTATFDVSATPTNNLTVTRSGTGTGTVTSNPTGISCGVACSADYAEGTVVTLTPTANAGSMFAGWTGDADCGDGQVTMNAARTCTATFDLNPLATFTLTVSKTGTGSGTVTTSPTGINCGSDCTETYDDGTSVTLIPAPASGSTFAGWSGDADCTDGNVTMDAARSCTATFDLIPPNTLAVTIAGTGSGTVTSSPTGISCPGDCSEPYSVGTTVTLTATPDATSTFAGWTGDPDCADGTVTMSAAVGCTATFDAVRTLTILISGGTGTVTSNPGLINCPGVCSDTFTNGASVALTPTPTGGSTFVNWTGVGCSANVTMTADLTCTANFIPPRTLDITLAGGGTGTVTSSPGVINCPGTCTDTFTSGTPVVLTPTPTGGSTFGGWTGTGCSNNVTMSIDRNCTATFDAPAGTQTLTITVTGGGTGTVTSNPGSIDCPATLCSDTFATGTPVALTPTPTGGSTFGGWTGTGCSNNVTMSIDRNCTATFDAPAGTQTLTITVTGGGTGTVTSNPGSIDCPATLCSDTFATGTPVALTPTPTGGSTFGGWTGTGCSNNVTMSIDRNCTATFDAPAGTQTLTITVTGGGTGTVTSNPGSTDCPATLCSDTFATGTPVALTPTPTGGSTFGGWTGAGCSNSVTMSTDRSCTATFDPPVQHQLDVMVTLNGGATGSVTSSPGSINCTSGTCGELFNQGTVVTLTAAAGGTFGGWGGACAAAGMNVQAMVTMSMAQACTATFDP